MSLRGGHVRLKPERTDALRPLEEVEKIGGQSAGCRRSLFFFGLSRSGSEAVENRGEPLRDAGAVGLRDAARTNRGHGHENREGLRDADTGLSVEQGRGASSPLGEKLNLQEIDK